MTYEKIPIYGASGTNLEMDVALLRAAQQSGSLDAGFQVNLFHSILKTRVLLDEEPRRRQIKQAAAGTPFGEAFEVHTNDEISRYRESLDGLVWLYKELYKQQPPGFTG